MKKMMLASIGFAVSLAIAAPVAAQDEFLGEIFMTGANFCRAGSLPTDGRLMSISENTALFSLLGTNFGGDGKTTYALPDLRGRFPMAEGQGRGLSPRSLGSSGGEETMALLTTTAAPATDNNAAPAARGDLPFDLMNPYLAVTFCIVSEGVYPSRP